jgi:MFS family permease
MAILQEPCYGQSDAVSIRKFGSFERLTDQSNALFLGGPWFVAIFQLPQRFQVIHGSSGTMAGVQTMPFTFAAPLGSAFASILAKKGPAIYVVILSGVLQTIGFALLAFVPVTSGVPARVYGFQVIAGFGCGINISTLLLLVPFVVEYRDKGEYSSSSEHQ